MGATSTARPVLNLARLSPTKEGALSSVRSLVGVLETLEMTGAQRREIHGHLSFILSRIEFGHLYDE